MPELNRKWQKLKFFNLHELMGSYSHTSYKLEEMFPLQNGLLCSSVYTKETGIVHRSLEKQLYTEQNKNRKKMAYHLT